MYREIQLRQQQSEDVKIGRIAAAGDADGAHAAPIATSHKTGDKRSRDPAPAVQLPWKKPRSDHSGNEGYEDHAKRKALAVRCCYLMVL